MDNANSTTQASTLVDELLAAYRENEEALTEVINDLEETPNRTAIEELKFRELISSRDETRNAIIDREFRIRLINDRGEYFQKKIDLADVLLHSYMAKELALMALVEELKDSTDKYDRLSRAEWRIQIFETRSAVHTQRFNKSELIDKNEGYRIRMEGYREAMKNEWNDNLNKVKAKLIKAKKSGQDEAPYRRVLDRADLPFIDEEEKIEFFIGLEQFAK